MGKKKFVNPDNEKKSVEIEEEGIRTLFKSFTTLSSSDSSISFCSPSV